MTILVKSVYVLLLLNHFDLNLSEEFYDEIAQNLINGHGYVIHPGDLPNLYRAPLYPLFLAGLYRLFGISELAVILSQILFDAGAAVICYHLAKQLYDEKIATIASGAVILYPFFSYYTVHVLSESLFILLLSLFILLMLKTAGDLSENRFRFMISGLVCGMAILCRPSLMYFPFFILVGLIWHQRNFSKAILNFVVFIIGVAIAVSPWMIRNHRLTGTYTLGTGSGYNLWIGNYLPTQGKDHDELKGEKLRLLQNSILKITKHNGDPFTPQNDNAFRKEAIRNMLADPIGTLQLMAKKGLRFWFFVYHPDHKRFTLILVPIQTTLLLLALAGVLFSIPKKAALFYPVAVILYFNLIHAVVAATFRYAIPIMPYVIILAVYGAFSIKNRIA